MIQEEAEIAEDKAHALRALALVSLHPRPDRRGYWKRRVRCTLVISRTHENWDEAENLGIAEYSDS